jgi:hypothetical protein
MSAWLGSVCSLQPRAPRIQPGLKPRASSQQLRSFEASKLWAWSSMLEAQQEACRLGALKLPDAWCVMREALI